MVFITGQCVCIITAGTACGINGQYARWGYVSKVIRSAAGDPIGYEVLVNVRLRGNRRSIRTALVAPNKIIDSKPMCWIQKNVLELLSFKNPSKRNRRTHA